MALCVLSGNVNLSTSSRAWKEVLNTLQNSGDGETLVDSPALGILPELSLSVFLIYDRQMGMVCLPDNPQPSSTVYNKEQIRKTGYLFEVQL